MCTIYIYIYIHYSVFRNVISKGGHPRGIAFNSLLRANVWLRTLLHERPTEPEEGGRWAKGDGKIAHAYRIQECSYNCTMCMHEHRHVHARYAQQNEWCVSTLIVSCLASLRPHTQINVSRSVGITGGCVRVRWMKPLWEGATHVWHLTFHGDTYLRPPFIISPARITL